MSAKATLDGTVNQTVNAAAPLPATPPFVMPSATISEAFGLAVVRTNNVGLPRPAGFDALTNGTAAINKVSTARTAMSRSRFISDISFQTVVDGLTLSQAESPGQAALTECELAPTGAVYVETSADSSWETVFSAIS
jgi:hypothetical protein